MRQPKEPNLKLIFGSMIVGLVFLLITLPSALPLGILCWVIIFLMGFATNPLFRQKIITNVNGLVNQEAAPAVSNADEVKEMREVNRHLLSSSNPLPLLVYTIRLPRDTDWKPDQALSLVRHLAGMGDFILSLTARHDEVQWQIIDFHENTEFGHQTIVGAVKAAYLDAEISEGVPYQFAEFKSSYERCLFFAAELANIFPLPMRYVHDLPKVDPLSMFVNAASNIKDGESISYYLYLAKPQNNLYEVGMDYITHSHARSGAIRGMQGSDSITDTLVGAAIGATFAEVTKGKREPKYPADEMKLMEGKLLNQPLIRCLFAVEANSPDPERILGIVSTDAIFQMGSEVQAFKEVPGVSGLFSVTNQQQHLQTSALTKMMNYRHNIAGVPTECAIVLCPQEIASLWHLPHKGFKALEIAWQKGKQVAAPANIRSHQSGVRLGTNKATRSEIFQPTSERVTHTLVIGKTGTGKTSFMQALVEQDIQAGNGVAVIDPLGSLVQRILQHGIPPEREADVMVLDIGYAFHEAGEVLRYPIPLNPLAKTKNEHGRRGTGEFAAVLGKLYDDIGQTRWIQTLQAALELLSAEPQATLYDIWTVIDNQAYRKRLLKQFDFNMQRKWEMLERGGALSDTSIQSVLWRLNQFLDYDLVRASTCHPDKLDFFTHIQQNKIMLVSVHADESLVSHNAQNVLGATVLSQIQMAVMAGAVRDPKQQPYMLYVDEVQNFATSSLDDMTRQARQKGLGLVVATQTVSSITPKTLKALEGNIGTLVAFECSQEDAASALPLMPEFAIPDLINMGRFKSVVSMRPADGSSRVAFSIDPVAGNDIATAETAFQREAYLRRQSVDRYTPMTYDEVNQRLNERYNDKPSSSGGDDDETFANPIN